MDTGTHRVYCCDEEAKLGPREYRIRVSYAKPWSCILKTTNSRFCLGTNVYVTDRTIDVPLEG